MQGIFLFWCKKTSRVFKTLEVWILSKKTFKSTQVDRTI